MYLRKIGGATSVLMGAFLFWSCNTASTEKRVQDETDQPWQMHHINKSFKIANSLGPGDLDRDGYTDYAVIDESLNLYSLVFHPGNMDAIREPWPTVTVFRSGNPEYAYLGDVDGDGNLDLIGVEGDDNQKGYRTGVRVIWGPAAQYARDSSKWQDGGHFPGTENRQYLYTETHDINADGALDIVVGGRQHPVNKSWAGLFWLEAPASKADRRNLSMWKKHYIDSMQLSGHGFVYTDINDDGYHDFVLANADWNTPDSSEMLLWYENPGLSNINQLDSWKKHVIHQSPDYYAKPQVAIGDLNADGRNDLAVQTEKNLFLFIKRGLNPVQWDTIRVEKPALTQWLARATKMVDINQDGKMDLVGMLIHNDGNLPKDKASVFWMESDGSKGSLATWKTHVIKWSHGVNSGDKWVGEKWDHCRFVDMDNDGDVDIIANAEEFYQPLPDKKHESYLSVVWFENALNQQKSK